MHIPDLRQSQHEITLEHCFVLLHKLGEAIELMEGDPVFVNIAREMNPQTLKDFYEDTFEPEAFSRLFQNEMGKGVLVGAFAQNLLSQMDQEDLDNEVQF